jgi:hypothetical protein
LPLKIAPNAPLEEVVDRRQLLLEPFSSLPLKDALLFGWRKNQGYRWLFDRKDLPKLLEKIPKDQIQQGLKTGENFLRAEPEWPTTGGRIRKIKTAPTARLNERNDAVQIVWSDYDPADPEWMYTINRMAYLPDMAAAGRRENRADIIERVFEIMEHWIVQCPCDAIQEEQIRSKKSAWGRHWKSPWQLLNCGLRLKHWLETLHILWDRPELTAERFAAYVGSMRQQALVCGRTSPFMDQDASGNHLLMETAGLLYFSLLPWLNETEEMRRTAVHNLVRCLQRQVLPDGAHSERIPGYHMTCVDFFSTPLLLCALNNWHLPGDAERRVSDMVRYAHYVLMPNRLVAHFGDCGEISADEILDFAGRLTGVRRPWKAPAAPARVLSANFPKVVKDRGSPPLARWFPQAGFISARSSWSEKANAAIMHVSGFGGGHSHSDWLSFLFAFQGRTIITERGINTYDPDAYNLQFRLGRAHNILQIGERDAIMHEKSMWAKYVNAEVKLTAFGAEKNGRAVWTARLRFMDETTWTRHAVFEPKGKLVLEDRLQGPAQVQETELRFHLNTTNACLVAPFVCITTDKNLPNVRISICAPQAIKGLALTEVDLSPTFVRREKGLLLCAPGSVAMPAQWTTVIEGL